MKRKWETRYKMAIHRAVSSAFKMGLDPVINPKAFDAEVHERMVKWHGENPKED